MPETIVVKVFRNELDQIVAMDSRKKWRIYDTHTQSFAGFAAAPKLNAPVEDEMPVVSKVPEPAAKTRTVEPATHSALFEVMTKLTGEITKLGELIAKAEAALLEANKKPQADPTVAEALRSEIADLKDKLEKAKAAQKKAEDALLAAKPAPGVIRTAFTRHPRTMHTGVGMSVMVAVGIILLASYGLDQARKKLYAPEGTTQVVTEVTKVPADYDSNKSELAATKSELGETKQKLGEAQNILKTKDKAPSSSAVENRKDESKLSGSSVTSKDDLDAGCPFGVRYSLDLHRCTLF